MWMPVLLLIAFVLTRWPGTMPLNFSVAYGLVFCAGAFPRRMPWWLVLAVMVATDVGLNLFYYHTEAFNDYMLLNYAAYAGVYFIGRAFTKRSSIGKLIGGGLLGAIFFYVVTNTAAWLQNPEYAKTIAGWIQALTVGTPNWPQTWEFFRNTLLSGGLFSGLIAAALQATEEPEPEEEKETEPEEAAEPAPEKSES